MAERKDEEIITMLLPLKDMAGNQTGEIQLNDAVFGAPVNVPLMHQAVVRQLSNMRGWEPTRPRRVGRLQGGGVSRGARKEPAVPAKVRFVRPNG